MTHNQVQSLIAFFAITSCYHCCSTSIERRKYKNKCKNIVFVNPTAANPSLSMIRLIIKVSATPNIVLELISKTAGKTNIKIAFALNFEYFVSFIPILIRSLYIKQIIHCNDNICLKNM